MAAKLTNAGLNTLMDAGDANFGWVAVGTGSQTPDEALTSMVAENTRVAVTSKSVSGAAMTVEAFFTNSQAVATLTEYAIWDAASSGNMLYYGLFAASVVKSNTKPLKVVITETLANA